MANQITIATMSSGRFEVFTAVKVQVKFFWVVMSYSVVLGYQCFIVPVSIIKVMVEAAWNSETLISCHNTAQHHCTEQLNLNILWKS
jgi:hypothetical protein